MNFLLRENVSSREVFSSNKVYIYRCIQSAASPDTHDYNTKYDVTIAAKALYR